MLNQILTPPDAAAVDYFRNIDVRQLFQLEGVSWRQYLAIADAFPDRAGLRITFDGQRLELMTTSAPHERFKKLLGRLFETLTLELDIDIACGGNTTLRREDLERGLEPDECYWVVNEPAMRHLNHWDPRVHPPPDLAFEIDITSSSINRQEIYAQLGVTELWRFNGERLESLILDAGRYVPVPESLAVPGLAVNDLLPFIYSMQTERENAILKAFIEWIHDTLRPN